MSVSPGPRTAFSALAAAALFASAQPPLDLWPLAYVCLVPWLVTLRSARAGAMSGLLFGTLIGVGSAWWIVPSLGWLGANGTQATAGLLLTVLWAKGIPFAIVGALLGAARRAPTPLRVALVPGLIAILDSLHSIPPWGIPWGFLGHSQWSVPGVAQLAAIGGVPLVSAVVALVNSLIAEIIAPEPRRRHLGVLITAAVGGVGALLLLGVPAAQVTRRGHPDGPEVRILAILPSIPRDERWAPEVQFTHVRAAVDLARREIADSAIRPDILVFPEMLTTTPFEEEPALIQDLRLLARDLRTPLVVGLARAAHSGTQNRYRNSVVVFDAAGELAGGLDKEVPIPLIEGEPDPPPWLSALAFGSPARSRKVEEGPPQGALAVGNRSFVVAICSEVLFPRFVRTRRSAESTAILHLANDSWFDTDSVGRHELAAGVFRAIEARLPLVRVAQAGTSVLLDAYGQLVALTPSPGSSSLGVRVRGSPPPGRAEVLALLGVYLSGAFFLGSFAAAIQGRIRLMRLTTASLFGALAVSLSTHAGAQALVGTLRLDGLSYISFEGRETYGLPSGSTIKFQFSKQEGQRISFSIQPADVTIEEIDIGDGATLRYTLAAPASGSLSRTADGGATMRFAATVLATRSSAEGAGTATYGLEFTTESASARSADGTRTAAIEGQRVVEAARYVQLVGATTNRADAYPEPGTAVTAVLSGTFDELPVLLTALPAAASE